MKPLLVAISWNHAVHQALHCKALKSGFERHGIQTIPIQGDTVVERADIHAVWSVKRPNIFAWANRTDRNVLVLERGHVQDRFVWTSMGWNGLANRGIYATAPDGERWSTHWGHLLQPWKDPKGTQRALIIGQCTGDASLYGLGEGFESWAQAQTDALLKLGYTVHYRPHPTMVRRGHPFCPHKATRARAHSLEEDLLLADLAVSYNSTAGVEAVLAGVPTVTMDEGAMAYAVTSHSLNEIYKPDRTEWCHQLAWTSFSIEEISSGFAWEAVKDVVALETITH